MIVPLTLADFLERAEHVYGDREAIVDEPNPPGGGLGRISYGEFAAMSRSLAAALDDLGVGEGERVAIVSPYAKRGVVAHGQYDHASILQFIEWRFGLDPLTERDRSAAAFLEAFDFDQAPRPPIALP